MKVHELSRERIDELKGRMVADEIYMSEGRDATFDEIEKGKGQIPDELVFKAFGDVDF